jgi:hypothetical protein
VSSEALSCFLLGSLHKLALAISSSATLSAPPLPTQASWVPILAPTTQQPPGLPQVSI